MSRVLSIATMGYLGGTGGETVESLTPEQPLFGLLQPDFVMTAEVTTDQAISGIVAGPMDLDGDIDSTDDLTATVVSETVLVGRIEDCD